MEQAPSATSLILDGNSRIEFPFMLLHAVGDPVPPELVDVIRWQCRVEGSTVSCSYRLTLCTSYCNFCSEEGCYNPYSMREGYVEGVEDSEEPAGGRV